MLARLVSFVVLAPMIGALCLGCTAHDFGPDAQSDATIDESPTTPCAQHCNADESCVYEIGACGAPPSCQPNNANPCTVVGEACGCDGGAVNVDCIVAAGYARAPVRTLALCESDASAADSAAE